jgi:hypothetical protein
VLADRRGIGKGQKSLNGSTRVASDQFLVGITTSLIRALGTELPLESNRSTGRNRLNRALKFPDLEILVEESQSLLDFATLGDGQRNCHSDE